jgi:predicted RNA-binding protein YlqC (UPF0109 family)
VTEDTLAWIARRLVDEQDAERVESHERVDEILLLRHVSPDDVGTVSGRQGRIARALRTVVRAGGAHGSRRTLLEIVD